MDSDEGTREPTDPGGRDPGGAAEGDEEAGAGPELNRLPPPAFPPQERWGGSRPRAAAVEAERGSPETSEGEGSSGVPDDAFISPDEPLRKVGRGVPSAAFISPDDPILPAERDEEGRVTGIGEDEEGAPEVEAAPAPPATRDDRPTIHELPYLLDGLAEKINHSGERALRAHSEMGHFEAALCAFLRGYLRGAEE